MGKKIGVIFGIIIVLVLLDIFARFLYAQSWFGTTTFSKELNPFDIITLIVTAIITIWFGIYISKKLTEQRYQKEYIINDIRLIEEEILFFERNTSNSSSLELQPTISQLNKLKNYIDRFSKSLEIFSISSTNVEKLNSEFNSLYNMVTNTEGINLLLNETNKHEINTVCNNLMLETRRIVCSINKH